MRAAGLVLLGLLTACESAGAGDLAAPADAAAPPADSAAPPPPPDLGLPAVAPDLLSQTGLYADIAARRLAPGVIEFTPRHELWSDGAVKRRFLLLPPGAQVDTSDLAHWRLPVGAQVWKEFRAVDGTWVETRRIARRSATGDRARDYELVSYIWRADGSDAVRTPDGATDVNGTTLDVPSSTRCTTCHQGEPGHVLGLSALQLDGAGPPGARLADLVARGLLSAPPAAGASFAIPGDDVTRAALGYLHANCGHCHNPTGTSWPDVAMTLQLGLDATRPEDTTVWKALVGVELYRFRSEGYTYRVTPGAPESSAVLYRMRIRQTGRAMPPIATELIDPTGITTVTTWITTLAPSP